MKVPEGLTGTYTIPDSVSIINSDAFCFNSLTKISVNSSNTSFSTDSSGVLFNASKTQLVSMPGAFSGSYTIPSTVTTISDRAFYDVDGFTSVGIPESITSIGYMSFGECSGLTTVKFQGSAPSINGVAFIEVTATVKYPGGDSTWTSSVRGNYYGTLTWVETSHLELCTKYATYLTLESTTAGYIKTLPCSWSINSGSDDVRVQTVGEIYTATALYKNSEGNYWYYITTSSGETGYVYGGNVKVGKLVKNDITTSVKLSSTTPNKGASNNITGSVSSTI